VPRRGRGATGQKRKACGRAANVSGGRAASPGVPGAPRWPPLRPSRQAAPRAHTSIQGLSLFSLSAVNFSARSLRPAPVVRRFGDVRCLAAGVGALCAAGAGGLRPITPPPRAWTCPSSCAPFGLPVFPAESPFSFCPRFYVLLGVPFMRGNAQIRDLLWRPRWPRLRMNPPHGLLRAGCVQHLTENRSCTSSNSYY